jgi:hypothetical protein
MYGIGVDSKNLVMDPSAFWSIPTDPANPTAQIEINTIKPQVDIPQALQLIQAQVGMWLQSQGIKPGAMGSVDGDNFASGVSKIIDEMDTTENRISQIEYFKEAEADLWDLTFNHLHPYWVDGGLIEYNDRWDGGAVVTEFLKPQPLVRRSEVIADVKAEHESGFLTLRDAIAKLNQDWSDEQIDEYVLKLGIEKNGAAENINPDT